MLRTTLVLTSLLLSSPLFAVTGQLLFPNGEPAAGSRLAVVGRSGSVLTDRTGRFQLAPDPAYPATLVVTGPHGEVYPPVLVNGAADLHEIRLEAAYVESVTVVSGVAPNIDAPPASAATVLGIEEIDTRQPSRLADAVEGIPGVTKTEESSSAVPIIRGLSGGRTLVLADGGRLTSERRAGTSAGFLDPFSLAGIEVSRGPGSVAYGSDAFGGVIHAIPREPVPGDPEIRLHLLGSMGGAPRSSAALEGSFDLPRGAMLLRVQGRRSDDQEDGNGEPIPHSEESGWGAAVRWVADLDRGRIRLGLAVDRSDDIERPTLDSATVPVTYPEETSTRWTAGFDGLPAGPWNTWDLQVMLSESTLVTDRKTLATETLERTDVYAKDGSIRLTGGTTAGGGALTLGTELVSRFGLRADSLVIRPASTLVEAAIEDADRHGFAIFGTWQRPLGSRLTAGLGLRGDSIRSENSGGYFGTRSIENTAMSGHASMTFRVTPSVELTVQAARGFREPTLSDRFFRGTTARGHITGNPDLEPETSLQLDSALRWSGRRASVALFGYAYQIDDLVERYRDPQRNFAFRNRGEADIRGIELEAGVPLRGGFELQGAASWSEGESETGDPIDEIAAPMAQATLRWAGQRGFAFARVRGVARDDRPGPLEVERPGYAMVDLSAGWRVHPSIEIVGSLDNALDRTLFASPDESAPLAPGRTVTLGLMGRF